MAACDQANPGQGYQCDFVDSVPEDFSCKKCQLVARSLTFSSCCGEAFCHGCIQSYEQEGKPCPVCGTEKFTIQQQVRYQKKVRNLQVYCNLKDRGCDWKGSLDELGPHLDPDRDNCQYVDTKCPLNCQQIVPKNKVEQHVAADCVKREFFCKYCHFKATFEEVTNVHLPECKYVPLQCPNLCGVTCEREDMEDHMKMCRLEEICCDFCELGCDERFSRENQNEHLEEYGRKHLMLAASLALKNKAVFKKELEDQRQEYEAEKKKLGERLRVQEEKTKAQERQLEEQKQIFDDKKEAMDKKMDDALKECSRSFEEKLKVQEKKMEELSVKFENSLLSAKDEILNANNQASGETEQQEQEVAELKTLLESQAQRLTKNEKAVEEQKRKLNAQEPQVKKWQEDLSAKLNMQSEHVKENSTNIASLEVELPKVKDMCNYLGNFERTFEMKEFAKEKAKDKPRDWKSPSMYTHMCGYKFCVGVDANGRGGSHGEAVYAELYVMPGEYDSLLKWPAKASFILELIHQRGGKNIKYNTAMKKWEKPEVNHKCLSVFPYTEVNSSYCFLEHSKLDEFLVNDTLKFCTSVTLH